MVENVPEWARERAAVLMRADRGDSRLWWAYQTAFARYIAAHEEPPVDPLRKEAKRLVLADGTARTARQTDAIKSGNAGHDKIELALAALRRGMELATSGETP